MDEDECERHNGGSDNRIQPAGLQTSDADIVQFTDVSVAVGDQTTRSMLEVLRQVDKTFREIPHTAGHRFTTSYVAKAGLRVDFVTPKEGRRLSSRCCP